MSRFAVSSVGCRPSRIAFVISGARKAKQSDAGDIAPVKSLGACDVANSIRLAADNPAEPFMSARECLDEVGVGPR